MKHFPTSFDPSIKEWTMFIVFNKPTTHLSSVVILNFEFSIKQFESHTLCYKNEQFKAKNRQSPIAIETNTMYPSVHYHLSFLG